MAVRQGQEQAGRHHGRFKIVGGTTPKVEDISGTIVSDRATTECGTGKIAIAGKFGMVGLSHNAFELKRPPAFNQVKVKLTQGGKTTSAYLQLTLVAPNGTNNQVYETQGSIIDNRGYCTINFGAKPA